MIYLLRSLLNEVSTGTELSPGEPLNHSRQVTSRNCPLYHVSEPDYHVTLNISLYHESSFGLILKISSPASYDITYSACPLIILTVGHHLGSKLAWLVGLPLIMQPFGLLMAIEQKAALAVGSHHRSILERRSVIRIRTKILHGSTH